MFTETQYKTMNYDQEQFYDQEVMFDYEDKTYIWQGDYSVTSWGDDESEFAPAYGEIEVKIENTYSFSCFQDESEIIPTPSLLMQLELEIERNY